MEGSSKVHFRNRGRQHDGGFDFANSIWYLGVGGQAKMQQHANTTGAKVQLCIQEPGTGYNGYICYPTWAEALKGLEPLKGNQRHVFELLPKGHAVKPYLDIDHDEGLPPDTTLEDVIKAFTTAICNIFKEDYDKVLDPKDLIWMESGNQSKFSLHLVISTHNPQLVFQNNGRAEQGAGRLATRLAELQGFPYSTWVDTKVYTSNRLMRMVGSSKAQKTTSILRLLDEGKAVEDSIITWLDPCCETIFCPNQIPLLLKGVSERLPTSSRDMSYRPPAAHLDFVRTRMVELVAARLHPTAYHDPNHGEEDPRDPAKGVKINYGDRSEPCFTGCIHEGTNNLACWVDEGEDIYMRCFSDNCPGSMYLGRLYDDPDYHLAQAITVDMPFLRITPPDLRGQRTMDEFLEGVKQDNSITKLDHVVDRWIQRDFHVLNLKSAMGTGKTCFVQSLLGEHFEGARVLMITYRKTLAQNLLSKFGDLGFVSYMEVSPAAPLWDTDQYPRVICQMDSLPRLSKVSGWLPMFDLIILDEIESLLQHYSASTMKSPYLKCAMLLEMIKDAKFGAITMDALWGVPTWQYLNTAGISQQLVHNLHKPPTKTFLVGNNEREWTDHIIADLTKGKNVVVCSLSIIHLDRLKTAVLESGVLEENEMLIYTSTSDSSMIRNLTNVNEDWMHPRLLMYSPSIEAGVDFSLPHYHSMYCYICSQSTSPQGLYQMTGRIRHLESLVIRCCAAKGLLLNARNRDARKTTIEETLRWIQWVDDETRNEVPLHKNRLEGARFRLGPSSDATMMIWASNKCKQDNARRNFLACFTELLAEEGHVIRMENVDLPPVRLMDPGDINVHKRILMEAPDVEEWEFQEIHRRRCAEEATQREKEICVKHIYKSSWGIDRVDESFIEENGFYAGSRKLTIMMRLLFPWLKLKEFGTTLDNSPILMAALVDKVLMALGFQHPFDTDHIIYDYEPYKERLLQTDMFRNYSNNARLFDRRVKSVKTWTTKDITESIKMILGAVGLTFISKSVQVQRNGVRTRTYTYRLDPEATMKMAELVKLKSRHFHRRSQFDNVQQLLDDLPLTRYGHLLDSSNVCRCIDLECDV